MPFIATKVKDDVQGTTKVQYWSWNCSAVTTGSITTGMSSILHVSSNNLTTEDVGKWAVSGGVVTVTGVTSNDVGTVKIEGI